MITDGLEQTHKLVEFLLERKIKREEKEQIDGLLDGEEIKLENLIILKIPETLAKYEIKKEEK